MQKVKIIKMDNTVIVIMSDGTSLSRSDVSDSDFNSLMNAESDEDIIAIMNPEYKDKMTERSRIQNILKRVHNSNILTFENNAIYWKEISELSMPKELVDAILKAEKENDELKLETYRNFWTLMSLNPNEQCRLNLFWFLNRNGLVISRCGFFVAYRNVCKTSEEDIYTDAHTHTFKIKIGDMVVMKREDCDSRQDVTCSRGLHLGARTWLKHNYFGDTGLVCLCNPAEVVAVPHDDDYGKLRTCAYLPIDKAEFDSNGDVIPYNAEDGFECEYVPKVIYEGLMGTEQDTNYRINIPDIPGVNRNSITDKLLDIARECIVNRVITDSK